jgi:FMN phosphatase YigB (HAD superfamily)
MTRTHEIVFLFDVDYTLLDNGHVERDLRQHLSSELSSKARDRYFEIFEELRHDIGYADFLGALERYRTENLHDTRVLKMSIWLVDYPFAQRLYPDALDVVEHVRHWGPAVILSDGDAVFQPRKIERSGLWDAFQGHVLIYIHKETMLEDVEKRSVLGKTRDHRVCQAGPLRQRPRDPGPLSLRRHSPRSYRRSA